MKSTSLVSEPCLATHIYVGSQSQSLRQSGGQRFRGKVTNNNKLRESKKWKHFLKSISLQIFKLTYLDASLPTIDQRLQSLEKMFTTFMATSIKDRNKTSMAIERLNDHLNNNKIRSKVESPSDSMRSIVPEKRLDDRRTSMFFGRSPIHDSAAEQQNHI